MDIAPLLLAFDNRICGGPLVLHDAAGVLVLLLLSPFLEEWLVRGGVQQWCLEQGSEASGSGARSVLLAGLVFSALHLLRGGMSALLVLPVGLLLGLLYLKTRRWTDCALAHGACNAGALLLCSRLAP